MQWIRLAGAGAAVALLLAGCAAPPAGRGSSTSASSPAAPAGPKRITVAIQGEISSFRSQVTSITPGLVEIEQFINAGLAAVDDRGALHARLAENVPSLENGLWKVMADGRMETTWVIRPGARWHDGTPFTADDVHFTVMQLGKDRDFPAYRHLTYDSIDSIDMPDERTALVRWNKVNIDADKLLSTMGTPWPVPVPKRLLQKQLDDKANFMQLPYWGPEFVGLGPYQLRDWVIGSYVLLDANDAYVLGRPKIDQVEVRFITDLNALVANIVAGSVDATVGRGLSLEQALELQTLWKAGHMEIPTTSVIAIFPQFINPNPPVMLDVRYRRAILQAMDRQALVDVLLHGQSSVAHSFINPREAEYAEIESSIKRYDYDPRAAAQLIEQLGYTRGADGMYARGGQTLSAHFQTVSLDVQQKALLTIADNLRQVGVASEIEVLAPQRVDDREYRGTRPGFELSRTPNGISSFLSRNHGSQTPLPEDNFRRYTNKSRYQNAEFDGLIDAYFATIPQKERVGILGQIVHHMTDVLNVIGVLYDVEPMALGNRLANVEPRKGEMASGVWNVHEWDVR